MWAVKKTIPTVRDYTRFDNPVYHLCHSEEEARSKRNALELCMAKAMPIEFYFDPKDYVCYEELSRLDRYLRDKHNSSLLTKRFEEGEQFNELEYLQHGKTLMLSDEKWLELLAFINRFFFYVEKIDDKGFVVVNNPRPYITNVFPEAIPPTGIFSSRDDAMEEIHYYIEKCFRFEKTMGLVGKFDESCLTDETNRLLLEYNDFTYIDTRSGFGGLFTSDTALEKIENGAAILLKLLESLTDSHPQTTLTPFKIMKL